MEQQRSDLLATAQHDTENLARAFAENTAHSIDAADQILLFLRAIYTRDAEHFSFAGWNESVRQSDGLILQVGVIDKSGILLSSNLRPVERRIDLSDREHFQSQRDAPQDRLFISKPVLGRESNRWSIQLTRKILAANGDFNGVMVASVDPQVLSRFYASVKIDHGFVFLAGSDDIIRAGFPAERVGLGTVIAEAPARASAMIGEQARVTFTDHLGEPLILSLRRLTRYGLVVGVAFNQNDVLGVYRRNRTTYIAGGAALSILALSLILMLVRNKRHLLRIRSALTQSRAVMNDTLQAMTQGIMMVDAQRRISIINRRAMELLGLPAEFMATSPGYDDLVRWLIMHGELGEHRRAIDQNLPAVWDIHSGASTYERVRPNGTVLEIRTVSLPDKRTVRTFTDITERHRSEARIAYLAHTDTLTGLANRMVFTDRLTQAIDQQTDTTFAVLFLDLDRFKLVNDTWGHATGDDLLVKVAGRLRESVRTDDCVARFGGDEFALLLTHQMTPGDAERLADRLIANLSAVYEVCGRQLTIGVSIGIARYPADGHTSEQLLKHADIALYAAKELGRGTWQTFSPEMDQRLQERVDLERDLRAAIEENKIEIYFQPICDIVSGQPLAYESLARWHHPIRGSVSPSVFITVAEDTGLIVPLGLAILRSACRTASQWPTHINLTVNVSPMQIFNDKFEASVLAVLHETGLAANRLGLEITEGVIIRNAEAVAEALQRLQRNGIRILLDDFGTGHAGLSYLVRFGFDCIKIDRSFVARMLEEKAAQAVIHATLVLSEELGLDVVAEGVETAAQSALLQRLGCRKVQGYFYGPPRPDWHDAQDCDPPSSYRRLRV